MNDQRPKQSNNNKSKINDPEIRERRFLLTIFAGMTRVVNLQTIEVGEEKGVIL